MAIMTRAYLKIVLGAEGAPASAAGKITPNIGLAAEGAPRQRSRQKPRFLPAAKHPGSAATFCGQIN
jgi:hypothetical protein